MKLSELPDLVGKLMTIQIDTASEPGDEDYREATGRILAAGDNGVVLQNKLGTEIVPIDKLLGFEEVPKKVNNKIVKRWILTLPDDRVKQHLVDRHAVPIDLAKALSVEDAVTLHEQIDHDARKLGHGHGAKPPGRRGRPRKVTESDIDMSDDVTDEDSEE